MPVGAYTRQVLDKFSADAAFGPLYGGSGAGKRDLRREKNVKQVVAKVVLGEADAGFD